MPVFPRYGLDFNPTEMCCPVKDKKVEPSFPWWCKVTHMSQNLKQFHL